MNELMSADPDADVQADRHPPDLLPDWGATAAGEAAVRAHRRVPERHALLDELPELLGVSMASVESARTAGRLCVCMVQVGAATLYNVEHARRLLAP